MSGPAEPRNGARFLFRRLSAAAEGVCYEAELMLPDRSVLFEVTFAEGGAPVVERAEGQTPAPAWAEDHLRALAAQLGRNGARSGDWPRRVLRWREA
jgi:hypothetical protein